MSGFVFFKKEIRAILRTYRIWLVPLIFVFFGILSPVTAKFTPALLKAAMQADNIQVTIAEPVAADAYVQWIKNLSQFGMLALILISMGLVSEEKVRGTFEMVVTKPVSRTAIVISKFLSQAGLLAVAAALGLGVCYLYTYLLFDNPELRPLALSSAVFSAYALLILSVTIFFSSLVKNQVGAGGLALLSYFALSIISGLGHGLDKYSPGGLSAMAYKLVTGGQALSGSYPVIGISLIASAIMIAASIVVLKRQEL